MSGSNALPIVSLTEAQAFVRVETGDEEALLAGLVRTASAVCETFLNQIVIARPIEERLRGTGDWQRLASEPIVAILAVTENEGALAPDQYGVELDPDGAAWVKLPPGVICTVTATAGLATDENEVPEPIRQGVIRLTAHLYANRDGLGGGGEPPAIVSALWRPYRRLQLR